MIERRTFSYITDEASIEWRPNRERLFIFVFVLCYKEKIRDVEG
jgi:hypothetical protein